MYTTIQFIHSWWAYLVLFVVVIATINALAGLVTGKEYGPKDFRLALFALIVTHLQFLIGLILFFVSPFGLENISNVGIGEIMKNSEFRLYAVEHPLIMLFVVVLITVGYSKHKKKLVSKPKFKTLTIFYTLALILMLSRIPWQQWFD
jgi:predicted permease